MNCSTDPKRLPRSLHESPAYDPAWRHLQVLEYLRYCQHLDNQEEDFKLSTSERDPLVRAYFKFRSGVLGPKYIAFRYAQDCDDSNDRVFMGSRIKAWTVAGIATAEIAKRLHTCVENIEMFQKLFFDVGTYQGDTVALGAILAPMLVPDSPVNEKERLWLFIALTIGTTGLNVIMDQRMKLTLAEKKEIAEAIHSSLAARTLADTLSRQFNGDPDSDVLEHYQKSVDARLRAPGAEDESKWMVYQQAIGKSARLKLERQGAASEARPMLQLSHSPKAQ